MLSSTSANRRAAKLIAIAVMTLAAALSAFVFSHRKGPDTLNYYERGSLHRMVEGTADLPFATRALVPDLIRTIEGPLKFDSAPNAPAPKREDSLGGGGLRGLRNRDTFEGALATLIATGCYLGMGLLIAASCFELGMGAFGSQFAGLIGILSVPLWHRFYSWIYDPMTGLLSALLLFALLKRTNALLILGFLFAVWNKETALLWIPVIALVQRNRTGYLLAAGLALVGIAIRLWMKARFAGLGGTQWENHLESNLSIVHGAKPQRLLVLWVYPVYLALIRPAWATMDSRVKIAATWVGLPILIYSFTFGNFDEIRVMYDALPALTMLIAPTLIAAISGSMTSAEPETAN